MDSVLLSCRQPFPCHMVQPVSRTGNHIAYTFDSKEFYQMKNILTGFKSEWWAILSLFEPLLEFKL